MLKGLLVIVALALVSAPILAGTYLMNDSGQAVFGLRVVFSEPARITGFGDMLTKVEPTGEAVAFTFSGGEVPISSGHWLNWEPSTAVLLNHEWLTEIPLGATDIAVVSGVVHTRLCAGDPVNPIDPLDGVYLTPLHIEGRHLVNASGEIVILRGAAVDYLMPSSNRGEPVLKRDLAMIKAWGGNVVRIPITPGEFISLGAEEYLSTYVDDLVRWAGELGLYAVVSWKAHGDPWRRLGHQWQHLEMTMVESAAPLAAISQRYAKCDWVLYSLWNENPAMTWTRFREAMIFLVDIVAEHDPGALVLVPGTHIATMIRPIVSNPIPRDNVVYASDIYQGAWHGKEWWRDDAFYLLESGYPLMIGEWGFGYPEVGQNHTSTPEEFGRPFLDFCQEHGISWTAWQWNHIYEIPMFYDYERLQPTPFGQTVKDYLGRYGTLNESDVELPPTNLVVSPKRAEEAGCMVIDVLAGNDLGAPYTILVPHGTAGWTFDHWEGPVDRPSSPVVSAEISGASPVVGVFRENLAATFDWENADRVLSFPRNANVSYWCNGAKSLSEAQHWGLAGHQVKEIRIAFVGNDLLVRWETYNADIRGAYFYDLRFTEPVTWAKTLFVNVFPSEGRARLAVAGSALEWRDLGSESILGTHFTDSTAAVHIGNFLLPWGRPLRIVDKWANEAHIIYAGSGGLQEYFGLPIEP